MSHPDAWLDVHTRSLLAGRIEAARTVSAATDAPGISRQTAGKSFKRYMESATAGLLHASLRPHRTWPGLLHKPRRRIIKARLLLTRGPYFLA